METMELDLIRIFVKVVQFGSFSKASEVLGIPKSTVSKSVTKLEATTGTNLLVRTTRSQTLTTAGRLFYESCLEPIQVLEDAQKSLHGTDSIIAGNVKITAPEDVGYQVVSPVIGELTQKYPQINFEMNCSNEIIDLVKDGYDLAVRIGHLKESNLKVRKIGNLDLIPVAAQSYLDKSAKIKKPEDLKEHRCMWLISNTGKHVWNLTDGKKTAKVNIKASVTSNQIISLLQMASAGGGVTLAPAYLCEDALKKRELVRVLDGWKMKGIPISLVSPLATTSSARLKIVSDAVFEAIRGSLGLR